MIKLPTKITPCPITEAVMEIRFKTAENPDAIFALIYNKIKDVFPKIEKQQIANLPDNIRSKYPYAYHYKLLNDKFVVLIGPQMFAISNKETYIGWSLFSQKSKNCFKQIIKLGIFSKIDRFGLRYIDFFDYDIFSDIKLKLMLNNKELTTSKQKSIRTVFNRDPFMVNLNITNDAILTSNKKGSIIDIDTSIENLNDFGDLNNLIEKAHYEQKKMFFSNLIEENSFFKKFKPSYKK